MELHHHQHLFPTIVPIWGVMINPRQLYSITFSRLFKSMHPPFQPNNHDTFSTCSIHILLLKISQFFQTLILFSQNMTKHSHSHHFLQQHLLYLICSSIPYSNIRFSYHSSKQDNNYSFCWKGRILNNQCSCTESILFRKCEYVCYSVPTAFE